MPSAVRRFLLGLSPSSDADLLARYADAGDPDAFAELVARFGPLVLGVCRRTLPPADADDAFQATFLLLARRADRVRDAAALPAWLHRVATRTAAKARRRRGSVPLPDVAGRHDPTAAVAAAELRAVLDAELLRLPERLRGPVVLCLLDGLTREAAAGRLGWSASTVTRRLAAGRRLLHDRLARRGLPAVALAGLADGQLRAGVPTGLHVAAAGLAGPRPVVPPTVAALATAGPGRGLLTAVAVACVLGGVGGLAALPPPADPPVPAPAPKPVAMKPAPPPDYFLWPVRTDLHRALMWQPADAVLLLNAAAALPDGRANVRALPLADLRQTLRAASKQYPKLKVTVAYIGPGRGLDAVGPEETVRLAVAGLCHEAGFERVRSEGHFAPSGTWADLVADQRLTAGDPDAAEPATADGPVTVYPVRTPLSRHLSGGGDVVLVVGPKPAGPDIPPAVRATAARAVPRVDGPRRRLTVVVGYPDADEHRQPLVTAYQRLATDLGYETGTVSMR